MLVECVRRDGTDAMVYPHSEPPRQAALAWLGRDGNSRRCGVFTRLPRIVLMQDLCRISEEVNLQASQTLSLAIRYSVLHEL